MKLFFQDHFSLSDTGLADGFFPVLSQKPRLCQPNLLDTLCSASIYLLSVSTP